MADRRETPAQPNWRDDALYNAMLVLDHRGWAWQCVRRDPALVVTDQVRPRAVRSLRERPPITVVSLSKEDPLAPWGLHFCAAASPFAPCRLAG
jgi:hypothetical protein